MKSMLKLAILSLFLLALPLVFSDEASAAFCGDNSCDAGESGWCSDCNSGSGGGSGSTGFCGDNICSAAEQGWCSDCTAKPFCGDGFCDPGESGWCSDCNVGGGDGGSSGPRCGDGFCDAGETPSSCVSDCGCTEKFLNQYRCSPNTFDRQREKQFADCSKQWVALETCTFGCQQVFADPSVPVSCFSPPAAPPQQPAVDNVPQVSIDVPASSSPGAQLSIMVTGTDDVDVRELNLFNSNNVKIASFDCEGIKTTCSAAFLANAPATPNTAFTFRARSKDSINQESGFISDSGVTTAAPVAPLPAALRAAAVPRVQRVEPRPLQDIIIKFPFQPLFMRSLSFPDSDCVKPGESALLAVKVRNTGRAILNDVSFSAWVPELGIRSRLGPVKVALDDRLPRFLSIEIPKDAGEGAYYLRFTVNNNRFARAVHRSFVVSKKC